MTMRQGRDGRRLDCRRARLGAVAAMVGLVVLIGPRSLAAQRLADEYREAADRIIDAATADHAAYARLTELVERFGPRVSGSVALERAIDWTLDEMKSDGLDNPHGDPVLVPHWVRGEESLEMLLPWARELPMLGLGFSVATPPGGIRAEVLVVNGFDELEQRAEEAHGRIVLFNVPFTTYGETVRYRTSGADMLQRMQERGERVELLLRMEAQTLPDAPSRNVMAEIVGSEFPDEVVVLGGHIDSWDVGQGAMDDAGGVVAAWEAVRLIKELGLRPRRTIRVVGWTSEENGGPGGSKYVEDHGDEYHVLAMESDGGVFKPSGFGFTGSDEAFSIMQEIGTLLERTESGTITRGGGGADIAPLMATGVPGMGLSVDGTRYFWYHHTHADTVDKLDPDEVALCVATMAVVAYVVADMPERLPR
jgi:carboxypeptidase Q